MDEERKTAPAVCTKYPMKRVEPALRNFIKVLQIDLDRLERHRSHMERVKLFFTACVL